MQSELDYRNKVILAPMGTLPFRLLAKKYGADIVYGEEVIDKAIIGTTRVVNDALGTIDFVKSDGKISYRTCKDEGPTVFQVGTSSAEGALAAALKVYQDVQAIDVNMGCPKHFSISGGMGAALLDKPEIVKDILTTLVRNVPIPITCKVRLKSTMAETLDFLKLVESTGIKAVTIHARTKPERPRDPAHWDLLKEIVDSKTISIPIIGNGDVFEYTDIKLFKEKTDSVMVARGASRNPSIFAPQQKSIQEMMKEYLHYAVETDNNFSNTKYVLMYMSKEQGKWLSQTKEGVTLHKSKNYEEICDIWGLKSHYHNFQKDLESKIEEYRKKAAEEGKDHVEIKRARQDEDEEDENEPPAKKSKTDTDNNEDESR